VYDYNESPSTFHKARNIHNIRVVRKDMNHGKVAFVAHDMMLAFRPSLMTTSNGKILLFEELNPKGNFNRYLIFT